MKEVQNNNQARLSEVGRYPIDLIGPHSHTLVIEPGVGSLSIGPSRLGPPLLHFSCRIQLILERLMPSVSSFVTIAVFPFKLGRSFGVQFNTIIYSSKRLFFICKGAMISCKAVSVSRE